MVIFHRFFSIFCGYFRVAGGWFVRPSTYTPRLLRDPLPILPDFCLTLYLYSLPTPPTLYLYSQCC